MGVAKKTLNFGLIGYKFMGKAHCNALKKVNMFFDPPLQANLTALCGRDEKGVKEAAEKFGWESYETSWEALVQREDIDVIDITTPNNTHKDMAIEAAKNKKHIFCENLWP